MRALLRLVLTIAIPILLTIGSVRIVMSRAWMFWEYTRPGLTIDAYGFTVEDRWTYGPYGIDYLIEQKPIKYLADLRLPAAKCIDAPENAADCAAFAESELQHMQDVQDVTTAVFRAGLAILILALISAGILWSTGRAHFYAALRDGGLLTLGAMAAIVLTASVAWDAFFDQFHELFFSAGTWQFDFSQTLIRLYPERFWFDAVLTIGVLVALGALVLSAWGWSANRGPR